MSNFLEKSVKSGFLVCVVLLTALFFHPALADTREQEHRSFVESIGAMIYAAAWPTAEYERASFEGVSPVPGGLEITFRVHGRSALSDGPLWTDVTVTITDGEKTDLRWGSNNAILFQPGESLKLLGQVLADINRDHRAPSSYAPETAPSTSSPSQVVLNQIARAQTELEARGFRETHDVVTGSLEQDGQLTISMDLDQGTTYIVLARCDQDCTDLDLYSYSPSGDPLTSDIADDDRPEVRVTPTRTGKYKVKVKMASCSRSPCYVGVSILGK